MVGRKVLGIAWVGTRTDQFGEMTSFYEDVLGLRRWVTEEDFAAYRLPDGDIAELFGPRAPDHDHFTTGPVVGFLVDDLLAAMQELQTAGVELLGTPVIDSRGGGWAHFRAPDGNVYELTANPEHPSSGGPHVPNA